MSKPAASPPTILPLCQADNWFYVHAGAHGDKVISRIVMWARMLDDQYPEGVVVGLLSVRHDAGVAPSLVLPSTSEGCYVHEDDLSPKEKEILAEYRHVGEAPRRKV